MQVTVRYMGQLRHATGTPEETIATPGARTAAEFLRDLADRHGEPARRLLLDAARIQPTLLLFVGDEQADPAATVLRDGDVLTLLTPIAGGAS